MNAGTNTSAADNRLTREQALAKVGDGVVELEGNRYMRDNGGRLVPIELVAPEHLLEDQAVRSIIGYAEDISAQIDRFRGHTFDDVWTLVDILAEKYDRIRGRGKGNLTLTTLDGCFKVQVQVQEQLTFGAELQVAKGMVDACITQWAANAGVEIRALVQHAFNVDQQGRINRSALFALRRLNIVDPLWQSAMQALSDAIRVIGSKEYVRFYKRKSIAAPWEPITVDIARAA